MLEEAVIFEDAWSRRRYLVVFETHDGRWCSAESIGIQLVERLRHVNDAMGHTKTSSRTNWTRRLGVYRTITGDYAAADRNISVLAK
jgi:hypothetical protein